MTERGMRRTRKKFDSGSVLHGCERLNAKRPKRNPRGKGKEQNRNKGCLLNKHPLRSLVATYVEYRAVLTTCPKLCLHPFTGCNLLWNSTLFLSESADEIIQRQLLLIGQLVDEGPRFILRHACTPFHTQPGQESGTRAGARPDLRTAG